MAEQHTEVLGATAVMQEIRSDLSCAAGSSFNVLITGDNGVGKEAVARLIHQRRSRCGGPFAAFNCSGVADDVLESELFGDRGLLRRAHGGTLFLRKVGAMSLRMQARLLKFLEDGEIPSSGGAARATTKVDVHIIAGSDKNLHKVMLAGRFREDLFYRLNVVHIAMPSLRDHREDIRFLVGRLVRGFSRAHGSPPPLLLDETLQALVDYSWPGNVRELKDVVEHLVVRADGGVVEPNDLPAEIRRQSLPVPDDKDFSEDESLFDFPSESGVQPAEPSAANDVETLINISEGGLHRSSSADEEGAGAADKSGNSHPFHFAHSHGPALKHWGVAALTVLVVAAGIWALRNLESRRTPAAVLASTPLPMSGPALSSPSVDPLPLPYPDKNVARSTEDRPIVASAPVSGEPASIAPPVTTARPLPAPPADERSLTAFAEEAIPPMPLAAPPIVAGEPVPAPAATSELPEVTAPSAEVDRPVVSSERDSVLRILHEYEAAFEGLDVVATAEVWPSVDRRALGRAFSTLKSQGLHFEDCNIVWNESNATAQCEGTLEFVRRVGRPIPLTTQQSWVFRMRKVGTGWMIEDVTASPGVPVARVRRVSKLPE